MGGPSNVKMGLLDDVVLLTSPESAREHCDEYRRKIDGLLHDGLSRLSSPDHAKAVRMLIQYADLQVTRVALWAEGPVDLLAYMTRNFLEWSLWCKFVSE